MVFTVFLFRLEPREINLDDLADLYTKAFADRIQFKSYMRSSTSPIGKRLLYTKPAVFDGDTLQIHGDAFNKILGVSLLEEEYMAYGVLVDRQVDWDNVVLPQSEKERVYSLVRYHTLTRQNWLNGVMTALRPTGWRLRFFFRVRAVRVKPCLPMP
jgi:hypothetical protein